MMALWPLRALLMGLTLSVSISIISAELTSNGFSVSINGIHYYISPYPAGKLNVTPTTFSLTSTVYGFTPITVIQDNVAQSALPDLFSNWTTIDDVFRSEFANIVFLAGKKTTCNKTTKVVSGNASSLILPLEDNTIPSGPYFLETATGSTFPVYRLYDDFAGAFTESLLQNADGIFRPLSAHVPSSAGLTIGVPSRLYFTKTDDKPLAGIRIGVKDIFALAGAKRSNGNRAWYNLYPASTATGTVIQRLIDAGAQIVGAQKLSQFANGEMPTADWVDYHSPFNPRGDGYQDPSSSSSGGGASIGSYDWLDVAVGSDTGGSIRGPASSQGLFGNRPSHGLVSLDHVMPLSPSLDTAGFLTRDPYLWDEVNRVVYGENYTSMASGAPKYPKIIYTLDYPTNASASPADGLFIAFANKLAAFLGGNISTFDIDIAWEASRPSTVGNLSVLLNLTYPTLISKDQTALVRDPFYADYAGKFTSLQLLNIRTDMLIAAHDGRLPFVDPAPLARWSYADSIPSSALEDAKANKTVFMDWFNSKVLAPIADASQCSSAILLYPGGNQGEQVPRNQYFDPPTPPFGFNPGRISPFAEVPDYVFPIGQVASDSAITNHTEYFPVAVDVLVAKGCDGLLVKLAQDLVTQGLVQSPKPGQTILGGDILMKKRAETLGINVMYVG